MKFRAKILDLLFIRQFGQILQAVSRSCKQLVLRISADRLVFILSEKHSEVHKSAAWCEFPADSFLEFTMEGVTPEDNEIYLDISSDSLSSTLHSVKSSHSVTALKIKLTKKVVPCITFEIESQTSRSALVCVHDIPVSIIGRKNWGDYQQPNLPLFDISLALPELRIVRRSLDRVRNLGPRLLVAASTEGKMSFTVESHAVKSCVTFSDLLMYETKESEEEEAGTAPAGTRRRSSERRRRGSRSAEDGIEIFRVEVDMKALLLMIPAENLKPTNFICSLIDGRMLHLFYIFGDVTLQYCIPGHHQ